MSSQPSPPSFPPSYSADASSATSFPFDLSPASLDTLPVITSILARLQTTSTVNHLPGGASPATQPPSQTQTATQSSPGTINQFSTTSLTTKDIPSATDELKHRLQKARAEVSNLPDMHRGIDEQQEEIRELEGKIKKQRVVLEKLRDVGLIIGKESDRSNDPDRMET